MVSHTRKLYRETPVGTMEVTLNVYGKSDADADDGADSLFYLLEADIENSVAFAIERVERDSEVVADEDDDEGALSPCKRRGCVCPAD